jgi:hypothetical protein
MEFVSLSGIVFFQPGINGVGNDNRIHSASQGIIRDGIGWSANRSCLRHLILGRAIHVSTSG